MAISGRDGRSGGGREISASCHLRGGDKGYTTNGIADSFHPATRSEPVLVDPENWLKGEAPVQDLLDDPIVALVMAHDRVSATEVREILEEAADRLARARVEAAA